MAFVSRLDLPLSFRVTCGPLIRIYTFCQLILPGDVEAVVFYNSQNAKGSVTRYVEFQSVRPLHSSPFVPQATIRSAGCKSQCTKRFFSSFFFSSQISLFMFACLHSLYTQSIRYRCRKMNDRGKLDEGLPRGFSLFDVPGYFLTQQ